MKRIPRQGCVLAVMAFLLLPDEAPGQTSGTTLLPPEKIKSMGQPPLIKPYLAGELTWNGDTDQAGGVGIFGLYKDLILPVSGGLGLSAEAYFGGALTEFSVPLLTPGTEFQRRVWSRLRAIPSGTTCTYSQVAAEIGHPTAVQAVARANGDNRIAILIPCHRVVGSDGKLTGYGGGLWRKQRLLEIEREG